MLLELMHYYYTIIIRIHTGIHFYYCNIIEDSTMFR